MTRTFTKEGFEQIKQLDNGGEMLFVSNFYEIAVECISKLYELGIKDIRFIPYNPLSAPAEETSNLRTAVIAGDTASIPDFVDNVIDIGDRVIDLSTIADVGAILGIENRKMYEILEKYRNQLADTGYGISKMLSSSEEIKKQLHTILQFSKDCIIAADLEGFITEYNESSERNFGLKKEQVTGRHISEVFPEIQIDDVAALGENVTNEIETIGGVAYVINKYGIYREDEDKKELAGVVVFCQKYMEMENKRNRLRSKMIPKGHVARYTMDSILGRSRIITERKAAARKMAASTSTVLITGESGTGKEVFAQAIHNSSARSGQPFVAINCSALTASLLESEIFGYEEGAFTGARKGGKLGLFEMADGGTIFLDEIGEMPFALQAKLLRVLMEKEVMRIGGSDVIRIDVRVIAATNKNLMKLMESGKFREDLYYRINVLPLSLPPLRERKEDIPLLTENFLCGFGSSKKLSREILAALDDYDWPGNIRELHNCIEYMYQMSEETIDMEDIPEYILQRKSVPGPGQIADMAATLTEPSRRVLTAAGRIAKEGLPVSRRSVHQMLAARGQLIGEQEIYQILKELERKGLVEIGRGRGGSSITEAGMRLVQIIDNGKN